MRELAPIADIMTANPRIVNLNQEDNLDIELVPLEHPVGAQEINNCNVYLKRGANDFEDPYTHWIYVPRFEKLYDEARGLAGAAPYVTGLRIIYGIDVHENNAMQLIYQPIKMFRSGNIVNHQAEYKNFVSGGLHLYDNTNKQFNSITQDEADDLIRDYKSTIHFNRAGNQNFVQGQDVQSVIFSFQEIFSLIYYNKGYETFPMISYVDIYNAVRIESDNTIKHSVLLSPELTFPYQNLRGKFANRSHMCPPSCNSLVYFV